MPQRICVTCKNLFDMATSKGQRCPTCQATHDAKRGTTTQRGYGAKHQGIRAKLIARWKPGDPCAHCRKPMWDKDNLDLAHTGDRTGYRGLAHADCNRGNR